MHTSYASERARARVNRGGANSRSRSRSAVAVCRASSHFRERTSKTTIRHRSHAKTGDRFGWPCRIRTASVRRTLYAPRKLGKNSRVSCNRKSIGSTKLGSRRRRVCLYLFNAIARGGAPSCREDGRRRVARAKRKATRIRHHARERSPWQYQILNRYLD